MENNTNSEPGFKALQVTEDVNGHYFRSVVKRSFSELPMYDVLINVKYSSLNYKDALSASGHKGVTKKYPHTPGIDASGVVARSDHANFRQGDQVIVTGYDLGMNTSGGFAEFICVPHNWVVRLPAGISLKEAMMLGTAGFTAAYAVHKLLHAGQKPNDGPIVVSGASGGVGSLVVALLAQLGFEVLAASGKAEAHEYLRELGAASIIGRDEVNDTSGRPLVKPRWAGAIDTVGGNILATLLKACSKHGNIAAVGNALSAELNTTAFPFILNGINLLGVDSATCPMQLRLEIWKNLASDWKITKLNQIATPCTLEELPAYINTILNGNLSGRKYVTI